MQNEELRIIQQDLENSHRRYADLYNFAPVGYFSIDRDGVILDSNQTGWSMLNRQKRSLTGTRFVDYVLVKDRPVFKSHLCEVFNTPEQQSCELRLKSGLRVIYVRLQSIAADYESGSSLCMRTAVMDLTAGKIAEEQRDLALTEQLAARVSVEESRRILQKVQKSREDERSYIAREIHDELGQLLTALSIDLSWIGKKYYHLTGLSERVASMVGTIDMTIDTVQKITSELRPSLLEHLGLASAIKQHAREFQKKTSIKCTVEIHPRRINLEKDLSMAIFRILQESLTNAARHADAKEIRVTLHAAEETVTMEIRDNGKGLDRKQIAHPESFGLIGMRERARAFGGKVIITGSGDKGTAVKVMLPVNGLSGRLRE
jgi:signal transduction histidine kinase